MSDDYYYSGQYAEEQAEAEAQAKEAAHRQGPWHVSEHTDGRDALIYDEDGFEVARVCYPNRDADAKLIAAAPGLLAAARAALHYMRLHKYADQAWADDLEAAIAAAMTPNCRMKGNGDNVADLMVIRTEDGFISAWFPTPDELKALNAGAPVYLFIYGNGHPPVYVGVKQE